MLFTSSSSSRTSGDFAGTSSAQRELLVMLSELAARWDFAMDDATVIRVPSLQPEDSGSRGLACSNGVIQETTHAGAFELERLSGRVCIYEH